MARFAYEDPLTRLANRRRVDETLAELDDMRTPATVLIGDVDGLKPVNDRAGHPAGDALLRGVAESLTAVATEFGALLVARLGGDEFCVILPGDALPEAERFAGLAGRRIATHFGSQVSLCWGAAARVGAHPSGRHLMIAADSALLNAKRLGSGRLWLHNPVRDDHADRAGRRGWPTRRGVDTEVVPRVIDVLDQLQPSTTAEALQIMTTECSRLFSAAAWAVWGITPDRRSLQTVSGIDSRHDSDGGLWVISLTDEIDYAADDFIAAAAVVHTGETYVASKNLFHTDVAERELLHQLGLQTVLGVGVPDQPLGYLVRLYFESERADLNLIAPMIRVLAHHCACRFCHRTHSG
ncbi:hypothetical protein TUM20983_36780 [Mycobacterium antarcticum]|nr:GGDEF domain-containing protein [Mycolicibacterium sp. TUM20983]GLP76568.1 hypothetical protein TUM20983_36780 [Mycolicibacterium sp. TUM20983]